MQVSWAELLAQIDGCTKCGLCRARTNPAPGEGDLQARIMFVGEGPGAQEDLQGRPFVGPAGQLLDKMLAAIALKREQVYIANIVKCRPPGNRVPTPDEAAACLPYLLPGRGGTHHPGQGKVGTAQGRMDDGHLSPGGAAARTGKKAGGLGGL